MFDTFINATISSGQYVVADLDKKKFILSFTSDRWIQEASTDHDVIQATALSWTASYDFDAMIKEMKRELSYESFNEEETILLFQMDL